VSHKRRGYTGEMSETQWLHLKTALPKPSRVGHPQELELRMVINAIFYVLVTGCQWRKLPNDYPNPNSVYYHYRKGCVDGAWQRLNRVLVWLDRRRVGRFAPGSTHKRVHLLIDTKRGPDCSAPQRRPLHYVPVPARYTTSR